MKKKKKKKKRTKMTKVTAKGKIITFVGQMLDIITSGKYESTDKQVACFFCFDMFLKNVGDMSEGDLDSLKSLIEAFRKKAEEGLTTNRSGRFKTYVDEFDQLLKRLGFDQEKSIEELIDITHDTSLHEEAEDTKKSARIRRERKRLEIGMNWKSCRFDSHHNQ